MQRQTRWGSCTVDGGGAGGVNGVAVAEAQTAAAVGGAVVVAEVVVAGVGRKSGGVETAQVRWRWWLATTGGGAAVAAVAGCGRHKAHAQVRPGAGGGHTHGQARDRYSRGGAPAMREQFYVLLRTGRTPNRTTTNGHQPLP